MSRSNGRLHSNVELEVWQRENMMHSNSNGNGRMPHRIQAKTKNQELYLQSLRKKTVTVVYGPAGTGKSMCAIGVAAEKYAHGEIDKILIARSLVDCGKQMPALPGDLQDKIQFHFASYLDYLHHFLGRQAVYNGIANETILLRPVEMLRGHTYENTFMIADEAQNLSPKQIKMFMSRIGQGSQIALIGDNMQSDHEDNGLEFCINRMEDSRHLHIAELGKEDILRHPIIGEILEAFDEEGV